MNGGERETVGRLEQVYEKGIDYPYRACVMAARPYLVRYLPRSLAVNTVAALHGEHIAQHYRQCCGNMTSISEQIRRSPCTTSA